MPLNQILISARSLKFQFYITTHGQYGNKTSVIKSKCVVSVSLFINKILINRILARRHLQHCVEYCKLFEVFVVAAYVGALVLLLTKVKKIDHRGS